MESSFPITDASEPIGHATHARVQLTNADQERWDERYRGGRGPLLAEISPWAVSQQLHLVGGRGLDVACGAGRYTLWLATLGYQVDAVDVSAVALAQLENWAKQQGCLHAIQAIQADLNSWRPLPDAYDLVLVSLYLNRDLLAPLQAAVRPEGLLLYTTYHTDLLLTHGDFRPEFLLQTGELLSIFAGWDIVAYEERRWRPGGSRSDCTTSLLARKPRRL